MFGLNLDIFFYDLTFFYIYRINEFNKIYFNSYNLI